MKKEILLYHFILGFQNYLTEYVFLDCCKHNFIHEKEDIPEFREIYWFLTFVAGNCNVFQSNKKNYVEFLFS